MKFKILNRSATYEVTRIYQCLLLIITLCGERKILSNIKKSQNSMTVIVGKCRTLYSNIN